MLYYVARLAKSARTLEQGTNSIRDWRSSLFVWSHLNLIDVLKQYIIYHKHTSFSQGKPAIDFLISLL